MCLFVADSFVFMPTTQIPNKLFFRIGEVCKIVDIEPFVLRFWETEFPNLAPEKSKSGSGGEPKLSTSGRSAAW